MAAKPATPTSGTTWSLWCLGAASFCPCCWSAASAGRSVSSAKTRSMGSSTKWWECFCEKCYRVECWVYQWWIMYSTGGKRRCLSRVWVGLIYGIFSSLVWHCPVTTIKLRPTVSLLIYYSYADCEISCEDYCAQVGQYDCLKLFCYKLQAIPKCSLHYLILLLQLLQ